MKGSKTYCVKLCRSFKPAGLSKFGFGFKLTDHSQSKKRAMQVFIAVLSFMDIVALTFLNGYWLITLDELELDHLNPADVAKRLNNLVYPEMVLHGVLMFLCVLAWAPWIFLLNLPIAVWHARRVVHKEHLMDPTEILRFKKLQQARLESIARTVFYGLQIVYGMYWMVSAIVTSAKSRKGGKRA